MIEKRAFSIIVKALKDAYNTLENHRKTHPEDNTQVFEFMDVLNDACEGVEMACGFAKKDLDQVYVGPIDLWIRDIWCSSYSIPYKDKQVRMEGRASDRDGFRFVVDNRIWTVTDVDDLYDFLTELEAATSQGGDHSQNLENSR